MDFINGYSECNEELKEQLNRSIARWDDGTPNGLVKAFNELIVFVNWQTIHAENMKFDYEEAMTTPLEEEYDGVDEYQDVFEAVHDAIKAGKVVQIIGGKR